MQYPFGILELLFARGLFFQIKLDPLRNRTDEKIVMDDGPQCMQSKNATKPTDGYACARRERGRHAKSALSVSAAKGVPFTVEVFTLRCKLLEFEVVAPAQPAGLTSNPRIFQH